MEKTELFNSNRTPTGINVSIKETSEYKCSKCGGKDFGIVYRIRTVSKLITGQSRDGVVPISMFKCTNEECGQIAEDLLPPSLKD